MMKAIAPERFEWFDYTRYTFSLGLDLGGKVFLSGHSASRYDEDARRIVVRGGMADQTRTAYAKIERILETAGLSFADVTRIVEYVTVAGIERYGEAAAVRSELFGATTPAINTVCVNRLLRPDAWIEVEVTAGGGKGEGGDGVVVLPSLLPVDPSGEVVARGDLLGQTELLYERGAEVLESLGLSWSNATKIVDYLTPEGLGEYKRTGRVRRDRLDAPYPASTGILMQRLAHPDALIQLDVLASRRPLETVNPGWERYRKLTYSPAVRAGDVLFMSGQAALDPATERAVHAGDIAAQAEYTYRNILAVLEAAGAGPKHLVKTVEYVTPAGLERYREVASVRQRLLRAPWPASTGAVCEALLRPEFLLEVDPMAVLTRATPAAESAVAAP